MAEYTRGGAIRRGFHDLATQLWPEGSGVQISLGNPGPSQLDDIVSIDDTTVEADVATLGPSRPRDETIRQIVVVSVFRAGGPEQETVVTDRAYELLGAIENHLRKTDPSLGGVAMWCFLTRVEFTSTDAQTVGGGRLAGIYAEFTARTRIRTN
jgi:hypothetical protein